MAQWCKIFNIEEKEVLVRKEYNADDNQYQLIFSTYDEVTIEARLGFLEAGGMNRAFDKATEKIVRQLLSHAFV